MHLRLQPHHGKRELVCASCGFVFWVNAKPTASVVLIRNDQVLLTKRSITPYKGWWDIPGGFLDADETPVAGLQREMREELDIRILQPRLLGIYTGIYPSRPLQPTCNIFYYAKNFRGTLQPQDDVVDYQWFPLRRLPAHIAFTYSRRAIVDARTALRR